MTDFDKYLKYWNKLDWIEVLDFTDVTITIKNLRNNLISIKYFDADGNKIED